MFLDPRKRRFNQNYDYNLLLTREGCDSCGIIRFSHQGEMIAHNKSDDHKRKRELWIQKQAWKLSTGPRNPFNGRERQRQQQRNRQHIDDQKRRELYESKYDVHVCLIVAHPKIV